MSVSNPIEGGATAAGGGIWKTGRTRTVVQIFDIAGSYEQTFRGPVEVDPDDPDPPPVLNPGMTATLAVSFGLCGFQITPYIEQVPGSSPSKYYVGATVQLGPSDTVGGGEVDTIFYGGDGYIQKPTDGTVINAMFDISGTVTFSIEVEEYIQTLGSGTNIYGYGTPMSNFWADVPDAPEFTIARIWESVLSCSCVSTAGGSASTSFTPTTRSDIIYATTAVISDAAASSGASCTWSITPRDIGSSGVFTTPNFTVTGTPPEGGTGSVSGWCAVSLASDTDPAHLGVSGGCIVESYYEKAVGVSVNVNSWENAYPDSLVAQAIGIPETDTIALSAGGGGASGTQQVLVATGSISGLAGTGTLSYYCPTISNYSIVSANITQASLLANGEDYIDPTTSNVGDLGSSTFDAQFQAPQLSRCMARGGQFSGLSLVLAETYGTPTGTFIQDPSASVTVVFTPEWPTCSYPFMRLHIVGHGADNLPATITIPPCSVNWLSDTTQTPAYEIPVYVGPETPDKTWACVTSTDGSDTTVEIPLYGPDNLSASPDTQDSDWPFPVRRPLYAGVYRMPSITVALNSPGDGLTIEVVSVELFRSSSLPRADTPTTFYHSIFLVPGEYGSTVDVLIPDWPLKSGPNTIVAGDTGGAAGPGTDTDGMTVSEHFVSRGLLIYQDGLQSLEETGMLYIKTTANVSGTVTYAFGIPVLAELIDAINGESKVVNGSNKWVANVASHPGWTATSLTPAPATFVPGTFPDEIPPLSYYLCDSLGWPGLNGGGLLRLEGKAGLTSKFDQTDLSNIPCQALYDSVDWHPGWIGFDGEGPSISCGSVLRAEGQGQALQNATPEASTSALAGHKQPLMDAAITLTQLDAAPPGMNVGAAAGIGTTDADGWYHTGGPGGRAGNVSHAIGYFDTSDSDFKITIDASIWWARHRKRNVFFPAPCPTLFLGDPLTYFPFTPQFSDPSVVPTEEWRRIKAAAQQDSGSSSSSSSGSDTSANAAADTSGDSSESSAGDSSESSADTSDSDDGQAESGSVVQGGGQ